MATYFLRGPFTIYLRDAMRNRCGQKTESIRTNSLIFYQAYEMLKDFDEADINALSLKENCRIQVTYLSEATSSNAFPEDYYGACVVLECLIKRLVDVLKEHKACDWLTRLAREYKCSVLEEILESL